MARFEFVAQQPLHAANLGAEFGRTIQNQGAWATGTQYVVNDLVQHEGANWIALTESIGSAPDDSNTDWAMFAGGDAAGADRTLSNLTSAATARSNLGLGTAATRGVGASSGTVAAGDDARFLVGIQFGNPMAADTLGTLIGKMELKNAAGATLGYIPVYDAITGGDDGELEPIDHPEGP